MDTWSIDTRYPEKYSKTNMYGHMGRRSGRDKGVTSLKAELGHELNFEEVKERVKFHYQDLFGFEYV